MSVKKEPRGQKKSKEPSVTSHDEPPAETALDTSGEDVEVEDESSASSDPASLAGAVDDMDTLLSQAKEIAALSPPTTVALPSLSPAEKIAALFPSPNVTLPSVTPVNPPVVGPHSAPALPPTPASALVTPAVKPQVVVKPKAPLPTLSAYENYLLYEVMAVAGNRFFAVNPKSRRYMEVIGFPVHVLRRLKANRVEWTTFRSLVAGMPEGTGTDDDFRQLHQRVFSGRL